MEGPTSAESTDEIDENAPFLINCGLNALLATSQELAEIVDEGTPICEVASDWVLSAGSYAELFAGIEHAPSRLPLDFGTEFGLVAGTGFDTCRAVMSGHNRFCHMVVCNRPILIELSSGVDYKQFQYSHIACDMNGNDFRPLAEEIQQLPNEIR